MTIKKQLILFPCNGNAIEALDCIDYSKFDVIGFVDDSDEKIGTHQYGVTVFDRSLFSKNPNAQVLAVPGSPVSFQDRDNVIESLQLNPNRFVNVIHPSAHISSFATMGKNCLLMEGVVLKAGASIGNSVCMLPYSVLHHDSRIDDYSLIGSSVVIAGYVKIKEKCYIGSGSKIKNNTEIGHECLVGMGSNVLQSLSPKEVYYGNPAKQKSI